MLEQLNFLIGFFSQLQVIIPLMVIGGIFFMLTICGNETVRHYEVPKPNMRNGEPEP